MKRFASIVMFLYSCLASAQECGEPDGKHWSTDVRLESAQVTLHWTSVYEGVDTVCGITYNTNSGSRRTLEVYGQPVANKKQSLIGFVTCADDGCEKEIHVADITRDMVLRTNLPIVAHQIYLKANWKGTSRQLLIDVESFTDGKALPTSRFLCLVVEKVSCSNA